MNNAKLWLVVKPTVGIPILLSAVAISSFAVHVAVLSKVTWYNDYLTGQELGSGAAAAASLDDATTTAPAAYVAHQGSAAREILVQLPDGTAAKAVLVSAEAPPIVQ
jgi:light-harvesting protein B-800-850 alpha chain